MKYAYEHSAQNLILRVLLLHATTGLGLTGLTEASAGLIIATIADKEAATTRYRASSAEVETIAALGTYAAPTAGKCRFKEVDAANHPGVYEIQLANARFAIANADVLLLSITGATNLQPYHEEIQLRPVPGNVLKVNGEASGVAGVVDANVVQIGGQTSHRGVSVTKALFRIFR